VIAACNARIGNLQPARAPRSMFCGTQVIAAASMGELASELRPPARPRR
jgi:hypothetical protein